MDYSPWGRKGLDTTEATKLEHYSLTKDKEMGTHSTILAWEIPWTKEPGGLQAMGSQRAGHDLATMPPPPLPS